MKLVPLAAVVLIVLGIGGFFLFNSFTGQVVNSPAPSPDLKNSSPPVEQNTTQNAGSVCHDTCTEDRCEGFWYSECVVQASGCKSFNSKGVIKGKCGVQCTTNADCSGRTCRNSTCVSPLSILTGGGGGGGGGGTGGTEPEPTPSQPPTQNTSQNNTQTNTTQPVSNQTSQNSTQQNNTQQNFSAVCRNNLCEVTEYGFCPGDCPGGPDWNYPTLKTFPAFLFYPNGNLKENAFFVINTSDQAQVIASERLALWAGNFSHTDLTQRIVNAGQIGNPYNKILIIFGNPCNNAIFNASSVAQCFPFNQPGFAYTVGHPLGHFRLILFAVTEAHLQQEVEFFVSNQSLSFNGAAYLINQNFSSNGTTIP